MRRLKITYCNIYYKNKGVALRADLVRLSKLRSHSLGIVEYTEGEVPGMTKTEPNVNSPRIKARPGWREVQTFVRTNKRILDSGRINATVAITNDPLAHDRWIDYAIYKWGKRRIMHLTTHFNAGIQGPEGRPLLHLPRTQQYAAHMDMLEDVIETSEKLGYDVFVTLDGNYKRPVDSGVRIWEFSPLRIPGMIAVENRIDYVLYNPKRWKLTKKTLIDLKAEKSPHMVIACRFKAI